MPFWICTPVSANWPDSDRITPILMVFCACATAGSQAAASNAPTASDSRFMVSLPGKFFLVGARMHEPGCKEKRHGLASAARLTLSLAYYRDLPGFLPAQSVDSQR